MQFLNIYRKRSKCNVYVTFYCNAYIAKWILKQIGLENCKQNKKQNEYLTKTMKKSLHTYYKALIYSVLRKFKIFTSVISTLIKTLYNNELQGYKLKVKIFFIWQYLCKKRSVQPVGKCKHLRNQVLCNMFWCSTAYIYTKAINNYTGVSGWVLGGYKSNVAN